MNYKSKANTALCKELTLKLCDVLESFTYEEIELDGETKPNDVLYPFRYYTKDKGTLIAVIEGEKGSLADVELMAVAINMLLAMEIEGFELKIGHSEVKENDEESEAMDMIDAVCDMLDGYGLSDYIKPDTTLKLDFNELCFAGFAGDKKLIEGGRKENSVYLVTNIDAIAEHKKGNVELKEPVPVVLVASDFPELSYQVAFGLRRQGLKTEGYVSGGSMTEAEEYCLLKGIPTLIWATDKTVVMKNIQSGETAETTLEKLLGK